MSDSLTNARGMALVAVLLFGAVLSTIALGLSLLVSEEHLVVRSMREGLGLQYAARAGLEAAARALDAADWDAVLRGDEQAPGVDGAPDGRRMVDGAYAIDLAEETALQNCGRATGCSDAELRAISVERPWGANNPTWRLFYFRPLRELGPYAHAPAAYLLVWAGDDGREVDGDRNATTRSTRPPAGTSSVCGPWRWGATAPAGCRSRGLENLSCSHGRTGVPTWHSCAIVARSSRVPSLISV
ncbi:MAG: hypothetical protein R2712_00780 [Vicinamibacterales bacterium]